MTVKAWIVVGLLVVPFVQSGAQTDSNAVAAASLAAETRAYAQRMTTLRREYLARASWADLGDRCNPGALRVFTKDTTAEMQKALQSMVERMEQTIVLQGVVDAGDERGARHRSADPLSAGVR